MHLSMLMWGGGMSGMREKGEGWFMEHLRHTSCRLCHVDTFFSFLVLTLMLIFPFFLHCHLCESVLALKLSLHRSVLF